MLEDLVEILLHCSQPSHIMFRHVTTLRARHEHSYYVSACDHAVCVPWAFILCFGM